MADLRRRGVRLNPKHDARTRAKIQTTQIIKRLTKFVNGEVEMTAPQVTAGLGLLKKTLPDVQSVEVTVDGNINHTAVDLSKLKPEELKQLERLTEKAAVIDGNQGGDGAAEPDTLH